MWDLTVRAGVNGFFLVGVGGELYVEGRQAFCMVIKGFRASTFLGLGVCVSFWGFCDGVMGT